MRAPTITRGLVRLARQAKIAIEECIVQAVRLHGKMLDRIVRREHEVLDDYDERVRIMHHAHLFACNEADQYAVHVQNVEHAVKAEKKELGLL